LRLSFVKMEAAGNDYIYIDGVSRRLPRVDWSSLAQCLSDRNLSVGSDGLILILPSDTADFRMRMFNVDGSEGDMCGNGVRCLARYVWDNGFTKTREFTVQTPAGIVDLEIIPQDAAPHELVGVRVRMTPPGFLRGEIPMTGDPRATAEGVMVPVNGRRIPVYGVSVGNPNCVIFVKDPDEVDLHSVGPVFENHPMFPDRTNVELVRVVDRNRIRARVWERGSGITMSCGTGAGAAAAWSMKRGLCDSPVEVCMPGGVLRIDWDGGTDLRLSGPVREAFRGTVALVRCARTARKGQAPGDTNDTRE